MKIIVLGGHGFVGKNVVEVLKGNNYEIVHLSRRDGLDLRDPEKTIKYFKEIKPKIIINLAANVGSLNFVSEYAAKIVDDNMRILLNVFKAAGEYLPDTVLIHPIANCGFPGNLSLYKESDFWLGPVHNSVLSYGSTRRMIDVLSQCYHMQYGVNFINFFVPNMYGPFDSIDPNKAHALDALIARFVKAKLNHEEKINIWGSGNAVREWLYARDFGEILKICVNDLDYYLKIETINIAQKSGLSIKNLVDIIDSIVNYKGEIVWDTSMPDGAPQKIMDDSLFNKYFKNFRFTPLEKGITETIDYYKSIFPY